MVKRRVDYGWVAIGILAVLSVFTMVKLAQADNSKLEVRGSVNDGTTTLQDSGLITKYFTTGVRQQQTLSLTASAFTTVTIPTGAKALLVDVGSVTGIKLKGVTGDAGISLDSTVPMLLPISQDGSATIGFQNMNSSAKSVTAYWF